LKRFFYIYLMFSSKKRLDNAYKTAKTIDFDDDSKFILFSDCHRGDNSFADDFANNRNIYFHALKHYYAEGFQYCELGDGDELWENLSFSALLNAHKNVYMLMKAFHKENRLHMIWGNHDMVYRDPKYVKKHLSTYFDPKVGEDLELFKDITYHEGLVLKHCMTGQELFLTGDIAFFNDGSCVHPRSITGIEIENGSISLIKWQINTNDDGVLQIVRVLLEGPRKLADYKTAKI